MLFITHESEALLLILHARCYGALEEGRLAAKAIRRNTVHTLLIWHSFEFVLEVDPKTRSNTSRIVYPTMLTGATFQVDSIWMNTRSNICIDVFMSFQVSNQCLLINAPDFQKIEEAGKRDARVTSWNSTVSPALTH